MNLHLEGKTALITGSSAGIGFASAVALAREGASVVLHGRDADRLADAEKRLLSHVPDASARTISADLSGAAGCGDLIRAAPEVDILINNAGAFGPQPFAEISDTEWTRFFDTNVMSGVRLSRHYLTGMLARNSGRIVFVSSDAAVRVSAGQLHYSVSKAAVLALSRGLAELTRGTEVTVNAVLPGATDTEGANTVVQGITSQTGMSRDQIIGHLFSTDQAGSLLQRLAAPEEVASLITYLASPLASLTNGAAVRADGGSIQTIL